MPPDSIAVLGGGLSGLSAAFHLSRRFPNARIIIIEKDTRFGGWIRSERVRFKYTSPSGTQEEASVLFEAGPRTLRADALSVLESIHLLDLTPSIVPEPSATPRKSSLPFYHVPGSRGVLRVPTSPLGLINPFDPAARLGRLFVSSWLLEPFRWPNRPPGIEDESVDAFFTRRFGAEFARVLGSALTGGCRVASSRTLSTRVILPALWEAEERGNGSIVVGRSRAPEKPRQNEDAPYELGDLQGKLHKSSVFSLKGGIGTLVNALVDYLQKQPNVQVCSGVMVTGLTPDTSENRFKVTTSSETLLVTHVISALPLYELDRILSSKIPLPHLTANPHTSTTVVNLVFPQPISISPGPYPNRFAYVVLRPPNGYSATNDSGVLGCVCDPRLDTAQDNTSYGQGISKLTVVLGSPYISDSGSNPKTDVDISALVSELSYQLDWTLPPPVIAKVHTYAGVPLYTVGHLRRMEELKSALVREPWGGRMEVIGEGVGPSGVVNCVDTGRNVGRTWD